ncbi:TniQ family protein [Streptomyces chartreusis]
MLPPAPLPRSLIPLPGESLPGLLLRLSHRLNQTPGEVTRRTGLAARTMHIPGRHLLMLEPPDLAAFSAATRLPQAQIDHLTLRPLAHRYPPIRDALTRPSSSVQRPRSFFPGHFAN